MTDRLNEVIDDDATTSAWIGHDFAKRGCVDFISNGGTAHVASSYWSLSGTSWKPSRPSFDPFGTCNAIEASMVLQMKVTRQPAMMPHFRFSEIDSAKSLIYSLEAEHHGREAAMFIGYVVRRNFNHRNWAAVNELLETILIDELTRWSMVALLRSTFSARGVLPAWKRLLLDVSSRIEVEERATVLRGLL